MKSKDYLLNIIKYVNYLEEHFEKIDTVIDIIRNARDNNRRVFLMGNGGSAAISSHLSCDLSKGTLRRTYNDNDNKFSVIDLTTNTPLITALANDISYEDIFYQQLRHHIEKEDVVLAISGSGNSPNILRAIRYANKIGAITISLTGFDGGELSGMTKYNIHIPSNHYGIIEDIHSVVCHLIAFIIGDEEYENR